MKVKIFSLIVPVVLVLALIVGAVYILQQQQVEKAATGYQYKEKLFQEQEVGQIDIEVAEEDWQSILDDPTAEEYVSATVTVNGETYENVGIRAKGNSSLSSVASSESDRYSLKVDFGQYNDSQTFYGLEKLNLNNNFSDSTQMKEFVAYEMLEQMDITVPAHSYVKVMLNGNYYGLMLAVEEIGAAFAQTNFGSTNGFLFKPEDEGSDLVYVSDDPDDYSGIFNNVKLNEKTAEARSNILTMIKEINEGSTASLDVEQVAKYFAVNTALVNLDSYQGSFHHNYYLYENADGEFSIVPWDYNMSFGGFGMGGGGMERPATDASEENEQPTQPSGNEQRQQPGGLMQGGDMMTDSNIHFSISEPVSGTTVDAIPLLKVILEDEQGRAYYEHYLEQFASDVFTEKNVAAITTSLKDLLYDAVDTDPSKFFTTEEFVAGAEGEESLSAFAKARSNSILQQLAGEIEGITSAGSGSMPNMGDIPENFTPPANGEMPEGVPENFTPPANGEMPEGAPENLTPPANGGIPEGMQTSPPTGEVPDSFPEPNGEQSQLPKETERTTNTSQQQDDIPVAEGELADTQRQNGNMPMRGNMGNPFGAEVEEDPAVTINTLYTVAASLLALVLAMFIVNIVSNRKYKRKKG